MISKILAVLGLVRMSELETAMTRIKKLKDYSNTLAAEAKRAGVNVLLEYETSANVEFEGNVFLHGDFVCLTGAMVYEGKVNFNPESSRTYAQGITVVPDKDSPAGFFITSLGLQNYGIAFGVSASRERNQ